SLFRFKTRDVLVDGRAQLHTGAAKAFSFFHDAVFDDSAHFTEAIEAGVDLLREPALRLAEGIELLVDRAFDAGVNGGELLQILFEAGTDADMTFLDCANEVFGLVVKQGSGCGNQ